MTDFEIAVIDELKGIKEAFIGALNNVSDEQKIVNKYNAYLYLDQFMENETISQDLKDNLSYELSVLHGAE